MMLNRTLFERGSPVAVAKAIPNPGIATQTITLDGSGSYHQDSSKNIVKWEWDFNADGIFDATGPIAQTSFAAIGNYPVTLRVTDDGSPAKTNETTITVRITQPPVAPTADAAGPYVFCFNDSGEAKAPFFLDGTKSINPDQGQKDPSCPGCPGDSITEYAWDLSGNQLFNDAFGPTPDVTNFFLNKGVGNYVIQLRVTDNSYNSYPSANPRMNLTGVDSAQVSVKAWNDPACFSCANIYYVYPKNKMVQINWKYAYAYDHFNIYRSTLSGGPYTLIGSTKSKGYLDYKVVNGTKYYYVVRPAALNGNEVCQSNEAFGTPMPIR